MPYPTITSRAMPYHNDGTVVKIISATAGLLDTLTAGEMEELNDDDLTKVEFATQGITSVTYLVMFFPERRDIESIFAICDTVRIPGYIAFTDLEYSQDSTNGLDGTWTNATCTPNSAAADIDGWRKGIAAVTSCNDVAAIRFRSSDNDDHNFRGMYIMHIYGHKNTGETADDILILDALDSDTEFAADLDFGDRPSETSTQWQIKFQNASTLTANNVAVTVDDPNDIIRIADADTGPWNTTKTYTTILTTAKSAICYVKCETPTAGTLLLGPHCPFIDVVVGSYT